MDYKIKLEEIEATIQENKEQLIRLQEKEKQLKENQEEVLKQLKELSLTPESLTDEINKLEAEINKGIKQAEEVLNPDELEPED